MKEIPLYPLKYNKFAIVDDEDFEWLFEYRWRYVVFKRKNGKVFERAIRSEYTKPKKHFTMHREILKTFSKYKGVTWRNHAKRWTSQIVFDKKLKHLGYFKDETEAAKAYAEKAIEYYGEFANLNISENLDYLP